jgi:hypothetical protein
VNDSLWSASHTTHLTYHIIRVLCFSNESYRKGNPKRKNPICEENEKEKEDAMQVTGLFCLKSFNEKGRHQPSSNFQGKAESHMDAAVKKQVDVY